MATGTNWTRSEVELAGGKLHLARAGSGRPVLVLHHDIGSPDRLEFYDALASRFDVIVPHHPGYGKSERPQWLRSVRDVAVDLSVAAGRSWDRTAPRWSGSALAAGSRPRWRRWRPPRCIGWCWSGAMGLKPPEGDIFDQAIVSYHRLCPRRVSRSGGVCPRLWRRVDRPAGRVGHLPRDVFSHRLEAVHVQPDPAASAGRGAGAGAGGVGRRRQDRAAERRRALCRGAAQGAVRDRARMRALRRHGTARGARPARQRFHRRELSTPASRPRGAGREEQEEAMHLMYFTEQPMSAYPAEIGLEFGATALMFSNKYFDPVAGSRLYNEYLEQYIYAEEMGVEGIMLNEHHNAPFCMQAKCNIFAAILAAVTKKAKIVLLGNPLPLGRKPGAARRRTGDDRHDLEGPAGLRLCPRRRPGAARQRRQPGLQPRALRGGARSDRRRLDARRARSAGRARTTSTASSTRGRCRCRSPIRGSGSPACCQQGDDHLGGASSAIPISRSTPRSRRPRRSGRSTTRSRARSATRRARRTAAICSRSTSPDSEEKAEKNARQFLWMQGEFTGLAHPVWTNPSGYFSPEFRRALCRVRGRPGGKPARPADLRKAGRRWADHLRHAEDGDPEAAPRARRDPAQHLWACGAMTARQQRGRADLHPPARPGGHAGDARDRQGIRPQRPVRSRRPGASALFDRHQANAAGRGIA